MLIIRTFISENTSMIGTLIPEKDFFAQIFLSSFHVFLLFGIPHLTLYILGWLIQGKILYVGSTLHY